MIWESVAMIASATGLICAGLMMRQRPKRKRGPAALETGESRYRSIVLNQSDMIVRWQPAGTQTWVNEPYCETFGASRDDLIGKSLLSMIAESDRERVIRSLAELRPESPSTTNLRRVILPNGEEGWQEWVDRAIFNDAGQIVEYQSVGRDVTSRVLAARELEQSEATFRSLIESTSDWVWEMDARGFHTYSNDRVRELLGYTPAELLGMPWHAFVHPDDLASLDERAAGPGGPGQGWHRSVIRVRHRDGNYRYLERSAVPLLGKAEEPLGYRGIDRDVTFTTLMSKISSSLVGCRASELEWRIQRSFADIGAAYGIEKISLWSLNEPYARRRYKWHARGVPGEVHGSLQPAAVPWLISQLRSGSEIRLDTLRDLPADTPDRDTLAALGVRAALEIPFFDEGQLVGITAFIMFSRERSWPEDTCIELRHLAEKIIAAHVQAEAAQRVALSERDLAQSEALAEVGSFAYYPSVENAKFPEEWYAKFSLQLRTLLEINADKMSFDEFMTRVHEEDRPAILDATERLFAGAPEVEMRFRTVGPSGKIRHIANRTRMDRDEQGRNLRIIGANRDVTERVRREEELKQALKELAELKDNLTIENTRLREEVRSIKGFEKIVGDSEPLRRCLDLVARVGPTDVAVLILGETGTGKELIANAIHELSPRRGNRMVSLNCATLPPELVESELFGHEKGAFTGAAGRRKGRFELADGGTLFLDEIGELPLSLQSKLLRVIEDGAFERVGGTETIRVDVRLIAATNQDLNSAVGAGRFRSDLYFRINTVALRLPPLRERKDDIPSLAQHFVMKHGPKLNKRVDAISAGLLRRMQSMDWPGNVRELENFIERSLIAAEGPILTTNDSVGWWHGDAAGHEHRGELNGDDLATVMAAVERSHIEGVLATTQWVIDGANGAASKLGLPASTLRYKMKKLGIARPH